MNGVQLVNASKHTQGNGVFIWINRAALLIVAGAYVAALCRDAGATCCNAFFIGPAACGFIVAWLGEKAQDYFIPAPVLRLGGWVVFLIPAGLTIFYVFWLLPRAC